MSGTRVRGPRRRPAPGVARRHHRASRGGQTTIEFAFTFVLLLMGLFGSVAAAIWSVASMDAVTATEDAARLAVATTTTGAGANLPNTAVLNTNAQILQELKSGMFGTTPSALNHGAQANGNSDPCFSGFPPASNPSKAQICAYYYNDPNYNVPPPPGSPAPKSFIVTVEINGCLNLLVPVPFGFGSCSVGVPIHTVATVHSLTYQQ